MAQPGRDYVLWAQRPQRKRLERSHGCGARELAQQGDLAEPVAGALHVDRALVHEDLDASALSVSRRPAEVFDQGDPGDPPALRLLARSDPPVPGRA